MREKRTAPVAPCRTGSRRLLCALPWLALLLGGSSAAAAADLEPARARAVFRGGGTLGVEGAEYRDGWAVLRLAEGAEIAVPARQIVKVEPLQGSRAREVEAPPAAPPPAIASSSTPHQAAQGPVQAAEKTSTASFLPAIGEAASRHQVHPELLAAMVKVESNFNPRAVSPRGAQGLLQLMPETWRRLGVSDPFDPWQNLEAGSRYLRALLDRFEGDIVLALAAYNAGQEAVERHRGLPPFPETRTYVDRVLSHFAQGF